MNYLVHDLQLNFAYVPTPVEGKGSSCVVCHQLPLRLLVTSPWGGEHILDELWGRSCTFDINEREPVNVSAAQDTVLQSVIRAHDLRMVETLLRLGAQTTGYFNRDGMDAWLLAMWQPLPLSRQLIEMFIGYGHAPFYHPRNVTSPRQSWSPPALGSSARVS